MSIAKQRLNVHTACEITASSAAVKGLCPVQISTLASDAGCIANDMMLCMVIIVSAVTESLYIVLGYEHL